jgi:hypothetical protein
MIRDLSETLRALLDDPALAGRFPDLANAQISFDRPAETFNPSQTTVDLFLYDVRENVELRSNEPVYERRNGEVIVHRPPLRVACSYLVTAWPVGGPDLSLQEHRLLGQALFVLSRHPTIPAKYLKGALVGQEPPLPLVATQADGLKNPAEFWSALGNRLRPSLAVTATIAFEPVEPEPAHEVIESELRLGMRAATGETTLVEGTVQDVFRVAGRVTDAAGKPAAGASVEIASLGLSTRADAEGRYQLGMLPKGNYTLRAEAGGAAGEKSVNVPLKDAKEDFDLKLT